jgi:acyl carrier protein
MNEQEIYEQLNVIFAKVLKKSEVSLSAATTAADVEGWTSLTHMILIDSIEGHFKVKFKLNEIMKFNNVGEMVNTIIKKLNK